MSRPISNPLHRLALTLAAPVALVLVFVLVSGMAEGATGKPTVSLEESCRKAAAVLIVEPAPDPGNFRVQEVLYDGTGAGIKKDAVVAVDLGGMVYEKGRTYILFLETTADVTRYKAVPQMRTEDGEATRERIRRLLATTKPKSKGQ